jgi:hypothetical protein
MTTKSRLTALALATATFTTASLLAGTASARPAHGVSGVISPKGGTIVGTTTGAIPPKQAGGGTIVGTTTGTIPPKQAGGGTIVGTTTGTIPPKQAGGGTIVGTITGTLPPKSGPGNGGTVVSCQIGKGCTETGGAGTHPPEGGHGPVDGDHHHHHGFGYGWGYGYGAPVVVEDAPVTVVAPAPVEAVPVAAHGRLPVAEAPCNCLTKQSMPDGSLLLQDICTKESWVVAPQTVGAR